MSDIGVSCQKNSFGRGAGHLKRSRYRDMFYGYIRDHRNIWMPTATELTAAEKAHLLQFFPARIVNNIKVKELTGMTGAFNHSASATTYGPDFIIIRKTRRSNDLLRHELVHACQYDALGIKGFAFTYADQYVDHEYNELASKLEGDAYDFAARTKGSVMRISDRPGYEHCK